MPLSPPGCRAAFEHAQTLHERSFCHLQLPHLQLDELCTRLRCSTHVLWLWLAIDPCTKILPVLQLGPRTQNAAHTLIHSLRQILAPGYLPLFTSDGLNLYFYALTAHFGQWLEVVQRGRRVRQWQVAAGLIYGQVKKSDRRRKLLRVTQVMRLGTQADLTLARASDGLLWTTQHCVYRAGESHGPSWGGSAGTSDLGHGEARPTTAGPPGMVASLLSFCASPRCPPDSTRAAARTRGPAGGATLPASYTSDGCGKSRSTMDCAGSALFSSAAGAMFQTVSVNTARTLPTQWQWVAWRR
jgi:hypothetical protein